MEQVIFNKSSDFRTLRENHYFFVDKTNFIKEWWESGSPVTLIMRPPNFGKTLCLSMVDSFFSNQYQGKSEWFDGLSIWKNEKYRKLQGTYPVIYLSFENIKAATLSDAKKCLVQRIARVYDSFRFITESEDFNGRILHYSAEISSLDSNSVNAVFLLEDLCSVLHHYYDKKVIILLDDFDVPLKEAFAHDYWDEMMYFMGDLFLSIFKVNAHLERGLIMGSTGRGFCSPLCDANNLNVIALGSERFSTSFGFTEDEVSKVLDKLDLSDRKEEILQWYGGFNFGESVCNPSSVIDFLISGECKVYRINPTLDYLISKLLHKSKGHYDLETESYYDSVIESLLATEIITTSLDVEITFDHCFHKMWSFLLAFGYLSIVDSCQSEDWCTIYSLRIPNRETLLLLQSLASE